MNIRRVAQSVPTIEGAGVRLRRAFGYADPLLDPFLLLDSFKSANPDDYLAGFPWHPHRGIETITYVLDGEVRHGDSLGNKGAIGPGAVQWMTAGSGIIHEEMPQRAPLMRGFQLWANLPAKNKMMDPRYRDLGAEDVAVARPGPGIKVRIVAGEFGGVKGPVEDVVSEPRCFDVSLEPKADFRFDAQDGHNLFAYVFEGDGHFDGDSGLIGEEQLIVFGSGGCVQVVAGDQGVRFLLASGRPIGEPVAWRGPIVMNTEEELDLAFREYRAGTFIKAGEVPR